MPAVSRNSYLDFCTHTVDDSCAPSSTTTAPAPVDVTSCCRRELLVQMNRSVFDESSVLHFNGTSQGFHRAHLANASFAFCSVASRSPLAVRREGYKFLATGRSPVWVERTCALHSVSTRSTTRWTFEFDGRQSIFFMTNLEGLILFIPPAHQSECK